MRALAKKDIYETLLYDRRWARLVALRTFYRQSLSLGVVFFRFENSAPGLPGPGKRFMKCSCDKATMDERCTETFLFEAPGL